jgi:nucleotide-binding universal stress UspA family protein
MDKDIQDAEIVETGLEKPGRRGDGGTFLVVAEETHEFEMSLRYAARLAQAHRGHVSILYVMEIDDFQHWSTVETMMRKEMREQAEKFVWSIARRVNELNGLVPGLYIQEGIHNDVLINLINEDPSIKSLVLGGGTGATGPGPLVSYFTGKGLGRLRVPVIVVPGHLDQQKIDAIS